MIEENDRIAIITGGSRGLGRNTAGNLARRGVDVIFTYHSNAAEAQSLLGEAAAMGRKAAAFQLDPEMSARSIALWTTYAPHCEVGAASGSIIW